MRLTCGLLLLLPLSAALSAAERPKLENQALRLEVDPSDASASLHDRRTGEVWVLGAPRLVTKEKNTLPLRLAGGVTVRGGVLSYRAEQGIQFQFRLAANPPAVDYSFDKFAGDVAEVLLLDKTLPLGSGAGNYYALPVRMGILLRPEGDKPYTRRIANYGGYTMAMFGAVKNGAALLAPWEDPYTELVAEYAATPRPRLSVSLRMRPALVRRASSRSAAEATSRSPKLTGPWPASAAISKRWPKRCARNPSVERFFGVRRFQAVRLHPQHPQHPLEQDGQGAPHPQLHLRGVRRSGRALVQADLGIDRALLVVSRLGQRRATTTAIPIYCPLRPKSAATRG